MSADDRPVSRLASLTPLHDALCLEFARRELTDERLAEVVAGWSE